MIVKDILTLAFETDEKVAFYDTTESDYMRLLCKGYAREVNLDTDQRGFIGNEEVLTICAMNDRLYIGIGNPSGK